MSKPEPYEVFEFCGDRFVTLDDYIHHLDNRYAEISRLKAEVERLTGVCEDTSLHLEAFVERAAAAEAREARLRGALEEAAGWFQGYADGHVAKGDHMKAMRNQERADACRAALSKGETHGAR